MEQRRCPMPQRCPKDIQLFGFGYDSVSNDYKLVVATTPAFAKKLGKILSLSLKDGFMENCSM
ncbi:hypothetical protein SLEP1_g53213 [Rubroshorea leprosula]|uniref:Uncharacterized protein n=1 Tax=Rubroshorea leprosula TaxID=152421 RepID=A0AAV5MAJ5_9ROSI|nr:hypothetical protein SLEP1_g53213 [Rubroshorea leprosula]